MALTVDVYKSGIKLGSGTLAAGARSITSYTAQNSRVVGPGRNVQVQAISGGSVYGTFNTRVTVDGGATLTIAEACPFA